MAIASPGPGWERNPGRQPERTKGKRIDAVLANGGKIKAEGTITAPSGWSADSARWTLTAHPFDIAWFRVL